MPLDKFCRMFLEYLRTTNSVDDTEGDFSYDLSKLSSNNLLDLTIEYTQIENEPTQISGTQVDYVYIKRALFEDFHTKTIIQNIYTSDRDAVRIIYKLLILML